MDRQVIVLGSVGKLAHVGSGNGVAVVLLLAGVVGGKATPAQVDECLTKYEAHVRSQPALMARLPELADRTLGCWCKPRRCHGDVLVKLLREWQLKEGHITPSQ